MNDKFFEKRFYELFNSGEAIVNMRTKEVFKLEDGEVFRQCYADTPERRTFPLYWFVSNRGNLLSVKKKKIQWLNKILRKDSNKFSYKYKIHKADGTCNIKNIEAHNLVGLVFGADSFGMAETILHKRGVEAFGTRSNGKTNIQGHHKNGDDSNNAPDNIKFVTTSVHPLLHEKMPTEYSDDERVYEYMRECSSVMEKENPNSITAIATGQIYDVVTGDRENSKERDVSSVKKIGFSKLATRQLQAMVNALTGENVQK